MAIVLVWPQFHHAVREITLPLRHEDIIPGQQAQAQGPRPGLHRRRDLRRVALPRRPGVGRGRTGPHAAHAGHGAVHGTKSGGTQFVVDDLGTPQVNIAYGAYYLRYLLRRYDGNVDFALAAYNAGEGNVDRWIAEAKAHERALTITAIPYSETRAYVRRVLTVRGQYRRSYAAQLGI